MNLRQIEAFRAVVESGSMSGAAGRLRISQPNVSRLIKDLEEGVGFRLFNRSRGGKVVATEDGDIFYEEVERTFLGMQHLAGVAHSIRTLGHGQVRIACSPAFGSRLISRAIRRFRERHPKTRIALQVVTSVTVLALVESRQVDFGIVGNATVSQNSPSELLFDVPGVCIFPSGHRLARLKKVRAVDLDGQRFISFPMEQAARRRLNEVFEIAGVSPDLGVETPYTETICSLVAERQGASVVNPIVLRDLPREGIEVRPFEPAIPFTAHLVFSAERPRSRLANALAECIRTTVQEECGSP